jgi:glycerol-3-phosphate acyltransferase PlsY
MTAPILTGLTLLGSYLIGGIPFGYLVARSRGVDIFHAGSGNIGATNVGRVLGRRFGILVFLLDFAKGAIPVVAARWLAGRRDLGLGPETLAVAAGLAAFLGHVFPVYLRFRGGKGVATGTGAVAVLLPGPALCAALVWLATVTATRYVSLASITAALALCAFCLLLVAEPFAPDQRILTLFCLVAAALVAVRHRGNLERLYRGTENQLRESDAMLRAGKMIHVLALGLWFGSAVFFSFVMAPVVFQTFRSPETLSPTQRDAWLPLLKQFDEPNEKTGTRLAGAAVGPIFPWYYMLQGVCGLLAVIPALAWSRSDPRDRLHRARAVLLILALATVVIGWPLAQHVSALRVARYSPDPAVAAAADAVFGGRHLVSLLVNMLTVLFVTGAMALAAALPAGRRSEAGVQAPPSHEAA